MEKKVGILVVIGIMLLGTSTLAGINIPVFESTEQEHGEEIALSIGFSHPTVNEDDNYAVIEGDSDMTYLMKEGFPMLPYTTKVMTFPFGTKIEDIEITPSDVNIMLLDKNIKPGTKPIPANMECIHTEIKEGEIYVSTEAYPSDWVTYKVGVGIQNGERVVFLSIYAYPYRYIPANNELLFIEEVKIEV